MNRKPAIVEVAPLAPVSDLMTVKQAAKYLNVSEGYLYDRAGKRARRNPKIPCIQLSGADAGRRGLRFRRSTLDRIIAELEAQSA